MRRFIGLVAFLFLLAGIAWAAFGVRFDSIWDDMRSALRSDDAPKSEQASEPGKDDDQNTVTARVTGVDVPDRTDAASSERSPFDVARISPDGVSVFAGKTTPNAKVTVKADGQTVGTAKADDNGEWVIAGEQKFASDDPELEVITSMPGTETADSSGGAQDGTGLGDTPTQTARSEVSVDDAPKGGRAKAVTEKLMTALQGLVDEARAKIDDDKKGTASSQSAGNTSSQTAEQSPTETSDSTAATEPSRQETASVTPRTNDVATSQEATRETRVAGTSSRSVENTEDNSRPSSQHNAQEETVVARASAPDERTSQETASQNESPSIVPVPLKFVYRKATMTQDGERAASLLLEYVRLKHFKKITLSGHADERGSKSLNMDLSLSRLHTVAKYLRDGGYGGELELIAKGEAEPFAQVDRSQFLQEELWELDRRVELRQAR